ncbi:MAG: DNA polymerase/3'-5' exonuclease PolX [Pirellulales bacterium]
MTNAEIAAVFEEIADLLEFKGENAFRIRAYRNAARHVEGMVESLAGVRSDASRKLTDIDGIGSDLATKIEALLDGQPLKMLEDLRKAVPASAFSIMRVPGLGPKKARLLVEQLGIDSLDALESACREGRVQGLKGFGAKTEAAILENVGFAKNPENNRLLWYDADLLVQQLLEHMRACPTVIRVEGAGSWRRGKQTVGDLDLLVESRGAEMSDVASVMDHFAAFAGVKTTLLRGDTKMSVRITGDVQVDLRVVQKASFGAALQYFTGSKEHNVLLRSRARERGLSINEYGVTPLAEAEGVALSGRGSKGDPAGAAHGASEEDVYAAVGLPWIPPELREGREEIRWAAEGRLPQLVTVDDIRGDLHMHTHATDGEDSLADMAQAAIARGLEYIAITDHGQRVRMAQGLDRTRLLRQWSEIDRFNEALRKQAHREGLAAPRLVVLKGIEVDMLEKGGLDLPDEVLGKADWVVASLHYGQNQPRAQITSRILEAIENPFVRVIGHPTGRLINRRPAYDVDMEAVIAAASRTGTFLEINANPMRLDLDEVHAAAAKRAGVKLVISTDAHSTKGLELMRCGIMQGRRAGLEAADVANTLPLADLLALMGRKES